MSVGYAIESLSRSASGSATINTVGYHPFLVGDKVRLYNVIGGGGISFMAGNPYTITRVDTRPAGGAYAFGYVQAGGTIAANNLTSIAVASATQPTNLISTITVTTVAPHGISSQAKFSIRGVKPLVAGDPTAKTVADAINSNYELNATNVPNGTTIIVTGATKWGVPAANGSGLDWSAATVNVWQSGAVVALDDGLNTQGGGIGGVGITVANAKIYRLRTEGQVLAGVMDLAYTSKGVDYPFLRLFDPSDKSKLTKSNLRAPININTSAATLRSVLDTVIESYQGYDAKRRRYYINQDGQLVYEITGDTQPPTATAPLKIITTGYGTPNASTSAATVAPYSLEVSYDHDTTKRALFRNSTTTGEPTADLIKFDSPDALGTAYTRRGAPYFDEAVDYPNSVSGLDGKQKAAKSYFTERYQPILSGSFTLRGAGTAAWNNLGFSSGYAAISSAASGTVPVWRAARTGGTVTLTTSPYPHHTVPGMTIVVSQLETTGYSGTFTVAGTSDSGISTRPLDSVGLTYASAGSDGTATNLGFAQMVSYGLYVRTGTAPNQIVTVTLATPHGLSTGALTTITGLTGAAGTSMNVTNGTVTVTSDYTFTYQSTGTNGTVSGTAATISSINLIPRWEPGQWVDIAAAELGLTGLYRVEAVDWSLEPGSFQQIITVTFNRRPTKLLTKLLSLVTQ